VDTFLSNLRPITHTKRFRGAEKAGGPHRYTAPAGGGKTPEGGWFVTSGGRAGERGLERSKGLFSEVPNPPLARFADRVCFAQAALRSDGTAKDAASGTLASIAKRPSTMSAGFHEGRGPPIKGAPRPEPQTLADSQNPVQVDRASTWTLSNME
jgi:hypothetical protein